MMDLETIRKVKEKYEDEWMKYDNVYGVGIGYKEIGGKRTDTLSIIVYTTEKKTLNKIPKLQRLPAEIEEIPVDVVEGCMPVFYGENEETNTDENMYRPMAGGIQICHLHEKKEHYYVLSIGTLGMFVKKKDDPDSIYILSNWHVLEKENMDIFQPLYDGSHSSKVLVANGCHGAFYESADAGIAKVMLPKENIQTDVIIEIGKIAGVCEEEVQLGQLIKKRGRTTRLTHGRVIGVDLTVSSKSNTFKHQVIVEGIDEQGKVISTHGDSGSVVLTYDAEIEEKNNKVLGLLWGGIEENNTMVYSPIKYVFEALNIEMCD